jgi:hypothetical protein
LNPHPACPEQQTGMAVIRGDSGGAGVKMAMKKIFMLVLGAFAKIYICFIKVFLIFLGGILILAIPHFKNFCVLHWRSFSPLDVIPICYGLPSWEGIKSRKVAYGGCQPSIWSATCPFCRVFPVRIVPKNLDAPMPPPEFLQKLISMDLSEVDRKKILNKRMALHKADDEVTCLVKFHDLIWIGTSFHGLIIYELSSHTFVKLQKFGPAARIDEISAIRSIKPQGDEIFIEHDFLCPTFFAVSKCNFPGKSLLCQRIR